MMTESSPKLAKKFVCVLCHYECSKESDYKKHLLTRKHKNDDPTVTVARQTENKCNCGKVYKFRQGLSVHKKNCAKKEINEVEHKDQVIELLIKENFEFKNIVLEVMKSNSDLQKQMIDVCKNSSNTIIGNNNHNHNNNNNNKTFNLQFFLNEQCKDAMNLTDFTNSFDLQLSDLESVGELGYVDGITKIFIDRLNALDIYKRPIHCSDAKREILYVKDNNIWTKEEKNNPKLRQAIKNVSFTNMKLVYNWSNAYPESKNNETRLADKYIKLVLQSSGGSGPILESENKIIRRIAKEILIEKINN